MQSNTSLPKESSLVGAQSLLTKSGITSPDRQPMAEGNSEGDKEGELGEG